MLLNELHQVTERSPEDAVGGGVSIEFQKPPPVSDRYVLVCVSNTVSPSSFSMQLIGQDTSDALDELMIIMQ